MMEQLSMYKTPIMEFESQEQLQQCLEEWKKILFLEDWIIKGILIDPPFIDEACGGELCGHNEFQIVNKCSLIRIVRPDDDIKERIMKYCAELSLVHELLHCKYNWTMNNTNSIEYVYFDTLEHGLIEQMAKSLIMAKYSLPFEWFKNF